MMIVQVINNGGVAQDQFDLLIPGGGVGALNACSNQWGYVGDLGATVRRLLGQLQRRRERQEDLRHEQVPQSSANKPELLAGCDWFINWFGAADNPNLVAKEITCPALLKSRGLP